MPHQQGIRTIAQNRKAFHDYFVEEKLECGIALFGTEVKSIRLGKVNLKESWAQIRKGEIWAEGMHIRSGRLFSGLLSDGRQIRVKQFHCPHQVSCKTQHTLIRIFQYNDYPAYFHC